MSVPTTRAGFKDWCLRELGHPVLQVNVTEEQAYDRIDQALRFWMDYTYDGTHRVFYKTQVTDEDKTNRYITVPENIIGAISVFNPTSYSSTDTLFNVRWQLAMNDLYSMTGIDLVPYYTSMYKFTVIEQVLIGQKPLRYNRHMDRVYIDMDWQQVPTGGDLIIEAYQVIDPDVYPDVWSDVWLQKYACALIQRQWGNNLRKFQALPLPGGIRYNGQQIYEEGDAEAKRLEDLMIHQLASPIQDLIG